MAAFPCTIWQKPPIHILHRPTVFLGGAISLLLLLSWALFFSSALDSVTIFSRSKSNCNCNCNYQSDPDPDPALNLWFDPPASTFYDDPTFGYTINKPIKNWDKKRRTWLQLHPSFEPRSHERVFIVTGSQSAPCPSPTGDHFMLRFYRNKVDYCRIHGYDIFYNNNVLLDNDPNNTQHSSHWLKIPAVRAAMVAHPEAEWIWWLDADTAVTDMEYKLPLQKYDNEGYNFIVHGYPREVYEKKSWLGLNSGSFLVRNCQWSFDFLERWADMGPTSPNFEKWGGILFKMFHHKAGDQTALAYLLVKEHQNKKKEEKKMVIETGYYLEGYWLQIVPTLENITERYLEIERREEMRVLRRRHAEKVSEWYGVVREPSLKDAGNEFGSWRRPFVTHFAGCQPCDGRHNPVFTGESCRDAMNMALNFADNQVLRNYGFVHPSLSDSSGVVSPLPFDYPTTGIMF